ncbi:ribosome-binding protein 1 isoform X2 [Neocloeon triangulifer]|uniref:ribosome-binding protein 1 isoform X2 n=1 Tax=Neocloeon triangulifer TaxID=2078957 RepID=UPI00286F990F|nr:ribosome-binding protein 1 isoform X2 [Neocloeon triangulifer]
MDLNTALISGAGTVLCGVFVAIIFIFGFKEKTFEEALDEQRRRGGELMDLIGDKARAKKPKKPSKKKEKQQQQVDQPQPAAPASTPIEMHPHVEFKFPEAEVVSERVAPTVVAPAQDEVKKKRKNKVKPILHNREEHSPLAEEEPVVANHFEEILPKDDVLMKRSISQEESLDEVDADDVPPPLPPKPKSVKVVPPVLAKVKQAQGKVALNSSEPIKPGKVVLNTEKPTKLALNVQVAEAPVVAVSQPVQAAAPALVVQPIVPKDKKKKKGDVLSLQQMISKDSETVTLGMLLPLVQRAELSRSEVHQLIEQLLNRERVEGHEWVEGRQDPVARLKKQLAEKEKALAEEQQGAQAVHAKLLELRAELNGEKSRQGAAQRQLEEQLIAKNHAIQVLNNQLQATADLQNKNAHNTQMLQNQLLEERKLVRKLTEEKNAALKSAAAQIDISKLTQVHQEEVCQLQAQIAASQNAIADLENRIQKSQSVHDELRNELNASKQKIHNEEQEKESLKAELMSSKKNLENISIVHNELEQRIRSLESDLKQSQEETKRLKAEAAKAPIASEVPDFSHRVKELEEKVEEKDALLNKLLSEKSQHTSTIDKLKEELEAQRLKNDDLRTKNWKVMEAATTAEKKLEAKMKECERLTRDAASIKSQGEEQDSFRQLLQRLFPEVSSPDIKDQALWIQQFETSAQQYLQELSSDQQQQVSSPSADESTKLVLDEVESQNKQLQAMVTHYKTIIEETEGMLNKLEKHVEQEEARWRRQLELKDEELEAVVRDRDSLKSKVESCAGNADAVKRLDEVQEKLKKVEETESSAKKQISELQARLEGVTEDLKSAKQSKEEQDANAAQLAKEAGRCQLLEQQIKELESKLGLALSNHIENKSKDATLNSNTNGLSLEPSISESRPVKRRRFTEWFRRKMSYRKRRSVSSAP